MHSKQQIIPLLTGFMRKSSIEEVREWGCYALSLICIGLLHGNRENYPEEISDVDDIITELIAAEHIRDDMFVVSRERVLQHCGLNAISSELVTSSDLLKHPRGPHTVTTSSGHIEAITNFNYDGTFSVMDPGYQNDVMIDGLERMLTSKGTQSKNPNGSLRFAKNYRRYDLG